MNGDIMDADYKHNIQLVDEILSKYDNADLLTFLAIYQLRISLGNLEINNFIESDLELVQYLSVTNEKNGKSELISKDAYTLIKIAAGSVDSHFASRVRQLKKPVESTSLFTAVYGGQYYRDWAYTTELIQILPELLNPFIKENGKYTIIGVYFELVMYIFLNTQGKIFDYFYNNFNVDQFQNISDEEFVEQVVDNINSGKARNLFVYQIDNLVKELDVDKDMMVKVLDFLSYENGTKRGKVDEFMTFNQVMLKPFVKLSEGKYALYSVSLIRTFFEDIMKQLWKAEFKEFPVVEYERYKAKYLENKVYELFKRYFPFCEIHRNIFLDDDFKNNKKPEFEIDLVLKYGDVLFIIDVKSHGVDNVIRKGKNGALKDKMKGTIVKANEQTNRLKKMIQKKLLTRILHTEHTSFFIDPPKYNKIYRMAVIFREYGGSHTSRFNLKLLGCMKQKTNDFSVMTLTDLMAVFDILTCPSERIDYLISRNEFQNQVSVTHGDEMDFLGYYLINRFNVDYKKYKRNSIYFPPELAQTINSYKNAQLYFEPVEKPKMKITPFWENIIFSLENNLGEDSRSITHALYRINFETQQTIINELNRMAVQMKFKIGGRGYWVHSRHISIYKMVVNFVLVKSEGDLVKYRQNDKQTYPSRVRYIHNLYLNAGGECKLIAYDHTVDKIKHMI